MQQILVAPEEQNILSDHVNAIQQDSNFTLSKMRGLQLLKAHAKKTGVPGYQVAVYKDDRLIWSTAIGFGNLEKHDPLNKEQLMRIGSVSKPVSALAAMKLIEEGKLRLEDDIRKYVPYFPEQESIIKVRHLLNHQSGIRHYTSRQDAFRTEFYADIKSAISIFKDDPLLFSPGEKFHYSSFGYNLLSAVIEGAAGKPFLDYLHNDVLRTAGLTSIVPDHKDSLHYSRSKFYVKDRSGYVPSPQEDLSYKWASGGLLSNAEGLASLGNNLLNGRVLKPETFERMTSKQQLNDGTEIGYGLGWMIGNDFQGRKAIYHNGNLPSGRAFLILYPKEKLSFAITANTGTRIFLNTREAFALVDQFLRVDGGEEVVEYVKAFEGVYSFETKSREGKDIKGLLQISLDGDKVAGSVTLPDFYRGQSRPQLALELGSFQMKEGKLSCFAVMPTFLDIELELSSSGISGSWKQLSLKPPMELPASILERMKAESKPKPMTSFVKVF